MSFLSFTITFYSFCAVFLLKRFLKPIILFQDNNNKNDWFSSIYKLSIKSEFNWVTFL